MTQDLQTIETGIETTSLRSPQKILDEAKERCTALTKMILETKSYKQIGDKKHLFVESWITLAQFYGCTGRIIRTEDIEIGGVLGFKAHAAVFHDQSGMQLSSAEAICMKDEPNWDTRPKYKWVDGKKEKDGEEKVPLHQVMSMAQTRALSKALAAKFRWVVVLGGWSATPAEEMTGNESSAHEKTDKQESQLKSTAPRLAFRKYKGMHIDDERVPVEELKWFLNYSETAILDPKKKNYKASNEELYAALIQEIARREDQPQKQEKAPDKTKDRPAMDDDAWVDFCMLWQSQNAEVFFKVSDEFSIEDASRLHIDYRNKFQDRIKELSKA